MKLPRTVNLDIESTVRLILNALDNNLSVVDNMREGKLSLGAGSAGPYVLTYAGTPEGSVTAPNGSLCTDSTNGEVYVKQGGTSAVGWKLITHA